MGAVLGVGLTDYPCMARSDEVMSISLRMALAADIIPPERKDPSAWPVRMRELWEADHGAAEARAVRASQVEEFRRVRKALDEFEPDAVVVVSKDHREALDPNLMVPYWLSAVDRLEMQPWNLMDDSPTVFGDPADTTFVVPGHRAIAYELIRGLQAEMFDPPYVFSERVTVPHAPASALVHLDWDDRTFEMPAILLAISPFGPRGRGAAGMSPRAGPEPMLPRRAFELGAALCRTILGSDRRIAIAAAAGWSHANNTASDRGWLWPDVEADELLFDRWRAGDLRCVADVTPEELEEHGWWEHTIWAVLAGAMAEAGSELRHSSLQTNYLFNSNWVTSIFSPVG